MGVRMTIQCPAEGMSYENSKQLPAPTTPRGLRLLCLLVTATNGQQRSLPIHTLRALPPRHSRPAQWALVLPAGFVLRETYATAPAAAVLARCAGHGQISALRAALGSVRTGGLSRDF
jgi:hypothetical protein